MSDVNYYGSAHRHIVAVTAMSDYDDWTPQKAALEIPCARCEALPNQPCTTISGRKTGRPHASRWEPFATAYSIGYHDGFEGGIAEQKRQAARS